MIFKQWFKIKVGSCDHLPSWRPWFMLLLGTNRLAGCYYPGLALAGLNAWAFILSQIPVNKVWLMETLVFRNAIHKILRCELYIIIFPIDWPNNLEMADCHDMFLDFS